MNALLYGFYGDVNTKSERFRCIGKHRFFWESLISYWCCGTYKVKIYFPKENTKLKPITEELDPKNVEIIDGDIYGMLINVNPYLSRNFYTSP